MIELRAMRADEFVGFHDYFVVDYAIEIAANFGYPLEKSRAIATRELAEDLPQTILTPQHFLLCIEIGAAGVVGYLWYKLLDNGETAFILDFMIFEDSRGLGYGKAALIVLEEQLHQLGVKQIKLRVAYDNARALGLYERIGFNITGYNMVKNID